MLCAVRTTCLTFLSGEYHECDSQTLTVVGGDVTRAEFEPKFKPPADKASDQSFRGPALSGHVFLADGKSPAFGALVTTLGPQSTWGVFDGLTDARGEIRVKASSSSIIVTQSWPPIYPSGYVVVARLPGSHGGTIVPLPPPGKPVEITLPPAIAVRGRVTVGGASLAGKTGNIRVFAAYEGMDAGRLGPYLSVRTTTEEDGTFELAGLTPGRYIIQAALDDIWLSPSAIVDVKDGSTNDLALAIPAPGGAVVVKVVGADGKPKLGHSVTVDRPAGPLVGMLWPSEWITDGAGETCIPALESGKHTLRLKELRCDGGSCGPCTTGQTCRRSSDASHCRLKVRPRPASPPPAVKQLKSEGINTSLQTKVLTQEGGLNLLSRISILLPGNSGRL